MAHLNPLIRRMVSSAVSLSSRSRCHGTGLAATPIAQLLLTSGSKRQMATMNKTAAAVSQVPSGAGKQYKNLSESKEDVLSSFWDQEVASELPQQVQYFQRMFEETVTTGKMNRGMAVVDTVRALTPNASESQIREAHAVGWALETTQASFLVADDIMDGSITRRGKDCWYRRPEIGMMAVNDVIQLMTASFELIQRSCGHHPQYCAIHELLTECYRKTTMGQSLDTMTSPRPGGKVDISSYSQEKYARICKYKTAFYTVSHPVRFGLLLSGVTDQTVHKDVEAILLQIGYFFQVQDDFLDCFGDPAVTGKIGRDIEDGKCCWPLVTALERIDARQRQLLEQNYGIDDATSVAKVKELYTSLAIDLEYETYEQSENRRLNREIDDFTDKHQNIPRAIFSNYLNKIFKRNK